jgi:hypothetical protein
VIFVVFDFVHDNPIPVIDNKAVEAAV